MTNRWPGGFCPPGHLRLALRRFEPAIEGVGAARWRGFTPLSKRVPGGPSVAVSVRHFRPISRLAAC